MLIKNNAPYRVLLPAWVFDVSDKEQFKRNLAKYMRNYPHYVVNRIEDHYAICEKR